MFFRPIFVTESTFLRPGVTRAKCFFGEGQLLFFKSNFVVQATFLQPGPHFGVFVFFRPFQFFSIDRFFPFFHPGLAEHMPCVEHTAGPGTTKKHGTKKNGNGTKEANCSWDTTENALGTKKHKRDKKKKETNGTKKMGLNKNTRTEKRKPRGVGALRCGGPEGRGPEPRQGGGDRRVGPDGWERFFSLSRSQFHFLSLWGLLVELWPGFAAVDDPNGALGKFWAVRRREVLERVVWRRAVQGGKKVQLKSVSTWVLDILYGQRMTNFWGGGNFIDMAIDIWMVKGDQLFRGGRGHCHGHVL